MAKGQSPANKYGKTRRLKQLLCRGEAPSIVRENLGGEVHLEKALYSCWFSLYVQLEYRQYDVNIIEKNKANNSEKYKKNPEISNKALEYLNDGISFRNKEKLKKAQKFVSERYEELFVLDGIYATVNFISQLEHLDMEKYDGFWKKERDGILELYQYTLEYNTFSKMSMTDDVLSNFSKEIGYINNKAMILLDRLEYNPTPPDEYLISPDSPVISPAPNSPNETLNNSGIIKAETFGNETNDFPKDSFGNLTAKNQNFSADSLPAEKMTDSGRILRLSSGSDNSQVQTGISPSLFSQSLEMSAALASVGSMAYIIRRKNKN